MMVLKNEISKTQTVVISTIILSSIVLMIIFNSFTEIREGEINEGAFFNINVVYASIAVFFVTWAISLSYEKSIKREVRILIPTENLIVVCSIILLFISYFISDINEPIINFSEIDPANYLRAIISLGVVLFTPGWLITNLFLQKKDFILETVTSILVSIIIVIFISIIFYWQKLDFHNLQFLFLPIIIGLWLINRKFKKTNSMTMLKSITAKIDRWSLLMILAIISVVSIAWAIHSSQNFMIAGDTWGVLYHGGYIINLQDVYDAKSTYPIIWSFIMSGLSAVAGLPLLNTNALLFPLSSLVIVSFYLLGKYAFELNQKILITSVLVYAFLEGLGWFVRQTVGDIRFWQLSYDTQDMYFQHNFFNNFHFSYIQISLVFAFISITFFYLSIKSTGRERIFLSSLSAFFVSFAFYTHILEAVYVIPILLFITIYHHKKITKPILIAFFMTSIILFLFLHIGIDGFYIFIFEEKFHQFFKMIDIDPSLLVAGGYLALISINAKEKISNMFFYFAGGGLFLIYVLGFYFWNVSPEYDGLLYYANQLPWYYLSTKFGIVGLLAISSLFLGAHKEKWSRLGAVWIIILFIIGNIWWGARMLDYILPVIAISAAYSIITLHNKFVNFKFLNQNKLRRNLAILPFLVIIVISSSSYLYGLSHYVFAPPDLEPQTVNAIRWVFNNVPKDSVVLLSDNYEINKAFTTISLHKTITMKDFYLTSRESSVEDVIKSHNIEYTYDVDNPAIFSDNGYELNYVKELNSPLAKLVLIDNQK